jgi:hypothetical protein
MPKDEWSRYRELNGEAETWRMKMLLNGKVPRLAQISAMCAELLRQKLKARLQVSGDPSGDRAREDDEFLWAAAKPILEDHPIKTAGALAPKLKYIREHMLNHPHY